MQLPAFKLERYFAKYEFATEFLPADRLPAACDINDQAISLGVMSKTYGLPGLRIGWIATHKHELYARIERLKNYTTICNSAPSEFLAEVALRHRAQLIVLSRPGGNRQRASVARHAVR